MATILSHGWHPGEVAMHKAMKAPTNENPSWSTLAPNAIRVLATAPVLAVGALDSRDRPWTSVWGSEPGFAVPVRIQDSSGNVISGVGMQCVVDSKWDPVMKVLRQGQHGREKGSVTDAEQLSTPQPSPVIGQGVKMSGLAIDLMQRNRAKLAGTVLRAQLDDHEDEHGVGKLQVLLGIESSLGNCPKYLNKIPLRATIPTPELLEVPSPSLASTSPSSTTPTLPQEALDLLSSAPLFFLTTSNEGTSLSTNHRGGAPGFLRVVPSSAPMSLLFPPPLTSSTSSPSTSNSSTPPILAYPEYSGNRLYQSLGNLWQTPYLGLAVPDFRSGSIFYSTCTSAMLFGSDAARTIPRSNLVVALRLDEWRLVRHGLSVVTPPDLNTDQSWKAEVGWSPYNPPARPLAAELGESAAKLSSSLFSEGESASNIGVATLLERTVLASGIGRFEFELELSDSVTKKVTDKHDEHQAWRAGQYVVLDFNEELGLGYRHMDDGDPQGLNDDLLRTFTVSSVPDAKRFEITIRDVGKVTHHLFRVNTRAGLEVPVRAFGGAFVVVGMDDLGEDDKDSGEYDTKKREVAFVVGGIGITPVLAQMAGLRERGRDVKLWWGVRGVEVGFVYEVVAGWLRGAERDAGQGSGRLSVKLFVNGEVDDKASALLDELRGMGVQVDGRRIEAGDLSGSEIDKIPLFYVCAGKGMSAAVQGWLAEMGKEVITESFDF